MTLFEIANMLDKDGKYLEADVVLDSMIRLATGRRTWRGNPNARPRTRFNPMPGARSVPVAPIVTQSPAASIDPPAKYAYSAWSYNRPITVLCHL